MDAVVVTILVIGILAIILLCATVLKHRKSLFRIATNNRFHVLSTVTLVLLIPEQLARATEFIALIAYNPEGVGKSANSRPLQWDQGTPEWVRSFALVVGDILQTVVAHCYVLVLLDRYYVFRPYLPFGNSVVFRRSLYGFFILMFIFSFSHFILMNSRKTSFSMSEQLSIMLARSLPFVAIAAFDLFVSIFVCRAAFSTTSLEYWENRLAAPNRSTTGETEEEQAWSLQKRPNLRKFNASSSIIGVHAPSPIPDTVAEGRSMNSVQLKEVVPIRTY
ncbi:hypothetical protein BJ742DRAFT_841336 [Cladochytrium replicatum]|nr:hypothetical protein BJ742DRAFT_841336 [Cladochytrium replicatum]